MINIICYNCALQKGSQIQLSFISFVFLFCISYITPNNVLRQKS